MATYNLGRVTPNFIGAWNNIREYQYLDVVSYSGCSYLCKRTNKNSAPTETNSNWILLAKKGEAQFTTITTNTYNDYE